MLNALSWGSVLAILAAGYTMTFGIIGLVNFAHGEVFMVGAFAAYFAMIVFHLPFWVGCLAAIVGSTAVGLFIERVAFRPVRGSGMITLFITSLAASFGIRTLFIMLFTDKLKTFPTIPLLKGAYLVGDLVIFKKTIFLVAFTLAVCLILFYLVKNTKTGIAMRAMSYDPQTAATMGVNTEGIIIFTFVISSMLAGVAALMWGTKFGSIQSSMGVLPVIDAFIASVLGGIGNVFGAVVSGYILGIGQILFVAYLPPELVGLRPLFVWIVFFILLVFRPSGLFRANIR
jgi:branched-chain amino acid transport system permease protein